MRIVLLFGIVAGTIFPVQGQTLRAEASYQYVYTKQWDRIIQAYNESRPFLDEKQPLIQHGVNAGAGYVFRSSGVWKHGMHSSYAFFGSSAENPDFNNRIQLHVATLNYLICRDSLSSSNRLYVNGSVGVLGVGAYRRLNGEPLMIDDKRSKAWGIGGNLELTSGYRFALGKGMTASPFVALVCSPYLYFPGLEKVINQTQGLVSKEQSVLLSCKLGFRVEF